MGQQFIFASKFFTYQRSAKHHIRHLMAGDRVGHRSCFDFQVAQDLKATLIGNVGSGRIC